MKLTDKRFWKFEAMMLLCGLILFVQSCIYITDNELVTIGSIIWSVTLIVPVLITSYLTKRWIMKDG